MRCQRELLVAAKLRRTDATRVAVKPEEAYDRTDAHATLLGGVGYGSPAISRFDHAPTQVLRIGSLNHIRAGMGIPDSAFSGNALTELCAQFQPADGGAGGIQRRRKIGSVMRAPDLIYPRAKFA